MTSGNPIFPAYRGGSRALVTLAGACLVALLGLLTVTPAAATERTSSRIIGGAVAQAGSWESQAALLNPQESDPELSNFCGGTLIDPAWILTAAHCLTTRSGAFFAPSDVQVATGFAVLSEITSDDRIAVAEVIVNPGWNTRTLRWDVALLRLAAPSSQPVMSMIQPSQISATAGGRPAEIAGWGCTAIANDACAPGGFPDSLHAVRTSFVSDAKCGSSQMWDRSFDPGSMICAGTVASGGRRACRGDSGGPVTASVGGRQVLAGLTSFGSKRPLCVAPNLPSVFTRVASVRGWVDRKLGRSPNLKKVILKPAKRKVRAGRKVSLRVKVTNAGDAATTATVKLSVSNRKKAKVPGSVKIPVDAGGAASGAVTVATRRGKNGKFTVKAKLGNRLAKSKISLKK